METAPNNSFTPRRLAAYRAPANTRRAGSGVVNSAIDRPWSQYFCCMLAGNREFVRKHPLATKRVVRAILKGVDFCAGEPARAARRLVDGRFHRSLRLCAADHARCPLR